jgi:hypothetical protein
MKKITLFLVAAISLQACKKNADYIDVIPVNSAAKYKVVDFHSKPDTYYYDSYGRQVKVVSFDGSRVENAYSKDRVTRTQYNSAGVLDKTTIIELNAAGLQAKYYFKETPANNTMFEYNQAKQVSKFVSSYNGELTTGDYFYSNGNLDSTRYTKNGNWYLTNVYEFHAGQPNVQKGANYGILYNGEFSKLMCKSQVHKQSNGTSIKEEYSYKYNAQGLVIELTEVSPNGTNIGYYSYY